MAASNLRFSSGAHLHVWQDHSSVAFIAALIAFTLARYFFRDATRSVASRLLDLDQIPMQAKIGLPPYNAGLATLGRLRWTKR
jgi:hypothetical protein